MQEARLARRDRKVDFVALDFFDDAVVIADEAAEFFDGDIERHFGDQVALVECPGGGRRLPEAPGLARFAGFLGHARAELDDQVAAVLLGLEEGAVGAIEHGLGDVAGLDFGDAEAGRAAFAAQIRTEAARRRRGGAVRRGGGGGVVAVGAEHDEFFAAVAGDEIAGAAGTFEDLGEAFDDFVAGRVAVGVVDVLEVIEIADDERAGELAFDVDGDEHGVDAVELGAVGQLGERVAGGLLVEAVAAFFERGLGRRRRARGGWRRGCCRRSRRRGCCGCRRSDRGPAIAHDQAAERLHAAFDGEGDRALVVGQRAAVLVAEADEPGAERTLQHAGAVDAGEPLGAAIPEDDVQVGIEEDDAVVHVGEERWGKSTSEESTGKAVLLGAWSCHQALAASGSISCSQRRATLR